MQGHAYARLHLHGKLRSKSEYGMACGGATSRFSSSLSAILDGYDTAFARISDTLSGFWKLHDRPESLFADSTVNLFKWCSFSHLLLSKNVETGRR